MSISVAIIGASGLVGSALAAHILRSDVLEPGDRLQLVGRGASKSEKLLLAERVDLLDAFDDGRIDVEMVPNIADVDADVVIMTAGVSLSPQCTNRRDMGFENREMFERVAEECGRGAPEALLIVVSNPVELAVRIIANKIDRRRIIGMGAQQDSLRFARAIAKDLGISRRDVRASVLGEHGQAMVPLWSSVELRVPSPEHRDALDRLIEESAAIPLHQRVAELRSEVTEHLEAERVPEAYEATRRALPDARVFIEPFITAHSLHSTPNATANATLQVLAAALAADRRRVHGQAMIEGEILGFNGVCGIPVTLSRDGWRPDMLSSLTDREKEAVIQAVNSINEFAEEILARPAVG